MPETIKALNGRRKVAALSRFARKSARISSVNSTLCVNRFEKDARGVPIPSNGIFWSVSHKPDFVAGVVSTEKIGLDIEQIKDVSDALFRRIVDPEERGQFESRDKKIVFFRAFTAKEAIVKKTREGMRGLSKVKIKTIIDDQYLVAECSGKKYLVENFYFDGYLASMTKDHFDVHWTIE